MRKLHLNILNEDQRAHFIQHAAMMPLPFQGKLGPTVHPQTRKQQNYCQYLCRALAEHLEQPFDSIKDQCKAQYGRVEVRTNVFTAEREAYPISFADYTREQAEAFILGLCVYLDENEVPYIPSEK